jgi:Bromodomain
MIVNAKQFNDKKSALYEDAERVRKTASNFFTRHNPAYRDPSYQAVATPIPGEINGSVSAPPRPRLSIHSEARSTPVKARKSTTASPAPSMTKTKSTDAGPAGPDTSGDKGDSSDFVGKTFMQAQDKIIEELIHYTDEGDELEIFTPFHHLPSRKLVDYYQVIKHPVSLLAIQKRIRGIHGRNQATWITDFQSWKAFEEEASFIWKNAREYNEDSSEIFELAGELEAAFNRRLADAKSVVEQPPQQKVTIKMPPKQSIRLTMHRSEQSPSTASRPGTPAQERGTPGVRVDNEALARQRKMVAAGIGGQTPSNSGGLPVAPTRNPFSRSTSTSTPIPTLNSRYSDPRGIPAQSPPVHTNGVKNEVPPVQSPAYTALRPAQPLHLSQSAMPPPNGLTPRPSSGSPPPPGPTGYHPPQYQYHPPPSYHGPLQGLAENKIRPADQSKSKC